ncbi:MAG: hypothetical protein WBC78_21535, partial [Candidatus Sulfotelmatobacter sp.]
PWASTVADIEYPYALSVQNQLALLSFYTSRGNNPPGGIPLLPSSLSARGRELILGTTRKNQPHHLGYQ